MLAGYAVRPILDDVLKQGVFRLFQHGLVRLGTPVLEEENIAVLKQLYWRYLIKDNFKVKENINSNLSNRMLSLHLLLQDWLNTHNEGSKALSKYKEI